MASVQHHFIKQAFLQADVGRLDSLREQSYRLDNNSEKFTLLVIGKSGVGKTQLLSRIFPEDAALANKVCHGVAGVVGAGGFDRYYDPTSGVTFLDSAGLEPGKGIDEYQKRLERLMAGDAEKGQRPVDCVWYCQNATDTRAKIEGITKTFDILQSKNIPVIFAFTQADRLDDSEEAAKKWNEPPPEDRSLCMKDFASWKSRYSCVKEYVFVQTKREAATHVKMLIAATEPYLDEGARIAFISAQVVDLDMKLRLSAKVLISNIGRVTAFALVNPIPFAEAALTLVHGPISGKIYKIWNLPNDCGGEVGALVVLHASKGMGKWMAVKGALNFVGAGWVSSLMDPGKAPRYHVKAGLALTAFLLRLHLATGGVYSKLSDDEFKAKITKVMERYMADWDDRVARFVDGIGFLDTITQQSKAELAERITVFLAQLAATLPAGYE